MPNGVREPVTIRGRTYDSIREAARKLGVSAEAVRSAKRRGTLDRVGKGKRQHYPNGKHVACKPITIDGVKYGSGKEAAEALGVSEWRIAMIRKLQKESLEQLKTM